VIIFKYFPTI